jgi:excisionase family DNA binding protein
MSMMLAEEYVTVAEAAALLKVSPSTIWRWIDRGALPAYRFGQRLIRLKRVDLVTVISPAHQHAPTGVRRAEAAGEQNDDGQRQADQAEAEPGDLSTLERERMLSAVVRARALQAQMLAARSGIRFPPAPQALDEIRRRRIAERP